MSDQNTPAPGGPEPGPDGPDVAAGGSAAGGSTPPPPPPTPPPSGGSTSPPSGGTPPPPPPPPAGGYPPPGAYSPAGPPRSALQVGDAISYGWKGFSANVGPILLIVLVVVLVSIGFNALGVLFDNAFVQLVFSLIGTVVGFIIALGLIRAALTITDGQKPSVGQVFQGDGVVQYIIAAVVLGIGFAVLNFIGAITILLLPVTFIATLILGFFVQFFGYAILDENLGAFDGIKRSFEVVRSNLGDLLLLWLAAVCINILGALLCGIGLLVTVPLTAIAWAYAWRSVTNGPVAPLQ